MERGIVVDSESLVVRVERSIRPVKFERAALNVESCSVVVCGYWNAIAVVSTTGIGRNKVPT